MLPCTDCSLIDKTIQNTNRGLRKAKVPNWHDNWFIFFIFFYYAFMSFLSFSVFVCIYFTSSPSFILFTLCVYSTLSIENFSYLLYNNNKNQTWLVPERASVKLCKREQAYGERESTLSLSYRSSRCGVIKLFTWVWPKSIIELILCFLFGAARSWHIDCSPRNSRFLSVYLTFSRVSSVYEPQKVFLYIHT